MASLGRLCLRWRLRRRWSCYHYLVLLLVVVGAVCWWIRLQGRVPIVVVEEHHEVLEYWVKAAAQGLIPRLGNTLIHFDGHSDDGLPTYFPGYPFFTWPVDDEETSFMMQRNDVFVKAAAIIGLIHRFVWIWPSWAFKEHDQDYLREEIGVGWTKIGSDTFFCECHKVDDKMDCTYVNMSLVEHHISPEVTIPTETCTIHRTYISEVVKDEWALRKLEFSEWFEKDESILLDIDEDFFGVEGGAESLLEAGVNLDVIKSLDSSIGNLMCPDSTFQERQADQCLRDLIKLIKQECKWSSEGFCQNKFKSIKALSGKLAVEVWSSEPSLFCGTNNIVVQWNWNVVAGILYNMTHSQIEQLEEIGFCFIMSPKTLGFERAPGHFQICHGFNTPGSTLVQLHEPRPDEVRWRLDYLHQFLRSTRYPTPKYVTIARSMRDGYTPKQFLEDIEGGLLSVLQQSRPDWTYKVAYDEDLLGGEKGWLERRNDDV